MKGHGARANGRQQIVGILGGQQQDQMLGRFFQSLQQRIRGLFVGAIDVIDQKNAALSMQRLELRALLQQPHLFDGDLPQRAIGRKGQKVGMRGKQQRIFVALIGRPFFALRDGFGIRFQAEVILLDFGAARRSWPQRIAAPRWLCQLLPDRPAEWFAGCAPAASSRTGFAATLRDCRENVRMTILQSLTQSYARLSYNRDGRLEFWH